MEIRKDLVLVSVEYENNGQKAIMTFLDRERKQVRVVNFNRQSYDNGKYVDDPEKAEKVDAWCDEYFGVPFGELEKCIGVVKDVYCYDTFNSLWESQSIAKFTKDMNKMIIQTEISEVIVDDYAIRIRYPYDGKTYESKMSYAIYMEETREWFQDPIKKDKKYADFESKFHVPVDRAQEIVGKQIIVEVKSAFGKFYYGDIKPMPVSK